MSSVVLYRRFGPSVVDSALLYCQLANDMLHELNPNIVTIADDVSCSLTGGTAHANWVAACSTWAVDRSAMPTAVCAAHCAVLRHYLTHKRTRFSLMPFLCFPSPFRSLSSRASALPPVSVASALTCVCLRGQQRCGAGWQHTRGCRALRGSENEGMW